nr:hypothetical protein [uncultured Tateyamaria sp.]
MRLNLFQANGVSLEEIAGESVCKVIAEKQVNKVDPEIEVLLGYNAAQFRQIVLLPEGDFRKNLTATNDERSPILKRLSANNQVLDPDFNACLGKAFKRQGSDVTRAPVNSDRWRASDKVMERVGSSAQSVSDKTRTLSWVDEIPSRAA